MTKEERKIKRDRMRFTKNTLSSSLALAAIIFNVFYFVSIYRSDQTSFYYQIITGASVVYNLLFMLIAFLSSEGVKNYKTSYAFVLLFLGAMQIVRIFYIPAQAREAVISIQGEDIQVMSDSQYLQVVIYLSVSALCCFLSAIISFIRNIALAYHNASLKKKTA